MDHVSTDEVRSIVREDDGKVVETSGAVSALTRSAARWAVFPAALAIYALTAAALRNDWLPRPELAMMGALLASAALAAVAERALPFRQDWAGVPNEERRIDRRSWLVLVSIVDPFLKLIVMPLLLALVTNVAPGLGEVRLVPRAWGWPLQWLIAILLAELGSYWTHRLAHGTAVMWGIHSFHHNPARLYWLNGFRVNPLNMAWHQLASVFVLKFFGTPEDIVHMVVALGVVIGVMQHCNADVRYDGWNLIFGTADLHRWHHAIDPDEARSNFGTLTVVWDRVFRTYRRGHQGPSGVGIAGDTPANVGYLSDLWSTYRRNSTLARRLADITGLGCVSPSPANPSARSCCVASGT
jgi:sterol desaturase/sphingolipid hydroxylase (fatty acid hydroxylase superfamily)